MAVTRRYNLQLCCAACLGRNLGRKSPLPGICEFWYSVVPLHAPEAAGPVAHMLARSKAAAPQGAVTVHEEEMLPRNAAGKVVTPVVQGAGERTPDRLRGSDPSRINLYLPNRPW
jgi:hypothetical protein